MKSIFLELEAVNIWKYISGDHKRKCSVDSQINSEGNRKSAAIYMVMNPLQYLTGKNKIHNREYNKQTWQQIIKTWHVNQIRRVGEGYKPYKLIPNHHRQRAYQKIKKTKSQK